MIRVLRTLAVAGVLLCIATPAGSQEVLLASAEENTETVPATEAPLSAPEAEMPSVSLKRPVDGVCPLPPTDKALERVFNLNQEVIRCHAALTPLPQEVSGLLEWLKRPDVCGKGMKARSMQACAVVFAALDDRFTTNEYLRPMVLTRIYRIQENDVGEVIAIELVDPDGEVKVLRPRSDPNDLDIRDNFEWLFTAEFKSVTDILIPSRKDKRVLEVKKTVRHCTPTTSRTSQCPHYIPILGLGLGENAYKRVLIKAAVDQHYSFDPKLEENIEEAMRTMIQLELEARMSGQKRN